jgi:hypothetical protein
MNLAKASTTKAPWKVVKRPEGSAMTARKAMASSRSAAPLMSGVARSPR